ncbi:MAG: endonuclease V, partial [Lachnospiraceae bacterium]|nr:endonuclease V [Lachnospiraceae bacterium]
MFTDKKEQEYIREQNELRRKINLENTVDLEKIRTVAGVDLAYWKVLEEEKGRKENGGKGAEYAVCCIVVLDYHTHKVIEKTSFAGKMEVPYIPGCLAYREIPVFLKAYKKLGKEPEVLFFDGNGYLHPRHMGLATHAGILLDKASVGVAKTYYKVGDVDFVMPKDKEGACTDIVVGEEIYGRVLRTHVGVKPVFVSVGNKIDLDTAVQMALALTGKESHIPLPTRMADLMTHKERRR